MDPQVVNGVQPASRSDRTVWILLACMVLVFVAVHLSTIRWFPLPWVDEVMYSDPSVNFVLGRGFTSSAWNSQPRTAFWAGNTPLHEWLLIPWISLFGVGPTSVRSLNVALVALLTVILVWGGMRLGLLSSRRSVLATAFVLLSSVGMAAVAREARPDGIKALVVALALLAYSAPQSWRRWALFAVGLLVVPAGFQAALFLVLACGVTWAFLGRRFFLDGLSLGLGCIAGFVGLMLIYWANGVPRQFLENTLASGHTLSGDLAQVAVFGDARVNARVSNRLSALGSLPSIFSLDRSHPWLIGFVCLAAMVLAWQREIRWRSVLCATILLAVVAPPLSMVLGKYFLHYTWIGCLPLALAVGVAIGKLRYRWAWLATGTVLVVGAFGFPRELFDRGPEHQDDLEAIEQMARRHFRPGDCVCADHFGFYAVHASGAEFVSLFYGHGRGLPEIPEADRAALTALFISPPDIDTAVSRFGGTWKGVEFITLSGPGDGADRVVGVYRRE